MGLMPMLDLEDEHSDWDLHHLDRGYSLYQRQLDDFDYFELGEPASTRQRRGISL